MLETLKENNFQFNKKFGQNFIFDSNLLSAIVNDAGVDSTTNVLEIGAGAGTLTKKLSEKAKKVVTYEIDKNLEPILLENLSGQKNVEIVFKDILKENIKVIEEKFGNEKYVIVANLPYYITTPIIFKFLDEATNLLSITIMVQKEVAERICAKHNTSNYGAITVSINAVAQTKITRIVKRNMFKPMPNVDSAVVNIKFCNLYDIKNLELFKKVVSKSFAMRRKTLLNNLKNGFSLSTNDAENLLNSLNFKLDVRGEALSVQDFVNLSNKLYEKGHKWLCPFFNKIK